MLVAIKNYRTLIDFQVDLTGKRGVLKKRIVIYGENGVGKSNFALSFYTLHETLKTMSIKKVREAFRNKMTGDKTDLSQQRVFADNLRDLEAIIDS